MQIPKKLSLLLCLCVFLPGLKAQAYELDQSLTSSIDDQTFALVHWDVTQLDLDALVQQALGVVRSHLGPDAAKDLQAELTNFQVQADAQMQAFLKSGGKDVFLVFSMYDFPYFSVVIPVPSGIDRAGLRQEVEKLTQAFKAVEPAIQASGDIILVGLKQTMARPRTPSAERLQVLTAALQSCENTVGQVVFFPSGDQRRILGEMLPPEDVSSGPLAAFIQGLEWVTLDINGPPSLSMNLTLQCPSSALAERVLTSVKDIYTFIGKQAEVQERILNVEDVLQRLTPNKEGRRLRLQLDGPTVDVLLRDALAPSLVQARAQAQRIQCMNNLKQIGLGLFMYADEHDDKLPPELTLSTIGKYLASNAALLQCPATRQQGSYVYRGATLTVADSPATITVHDKMANHAGGRNVAFLDGHVEWATEDRFRKLIEEDNKYRQSKQLPVVPLQ